MVLEKIFKPCYNNYIMKKYCLFIFILALAASFTACKSRNAPREVLFVENPPTLTTMTMTTSVPVDTYSEYMATYTRSETAETSESRYRYSRPDGFGVDGFGADTAFSYNRDAAFGNDMYRDTAASFTVTTVPEEESGTQTEVPSAFSDGDTDTVTSVRTTERFVDTAASVYSRQRDTMQSREFSRDTMYSTTRTEKTAESSETAENTTGGADNAH